jgi:predicted transcriptional regulator
MGTKAVSVKLSPEEHARIAAVAGKRDRSAHYVMREAVLDFLEREEQRIGLAEEAEASWRDYKESGEFISLDRAVAWAKSGATDLPKWEK